MDGVALPCLELVPIYALLLLLGNDVVVVLYKG